MVPQGSLVYLYYKGARNPSYYKALTLWGSVGAEDLGSLNPKLKPQTLNPKALSVLSGIQSARVACGSLFF